METENIGPHATITRTVTTNTVLGTDIGRTAAPDVLRAIADKIECGEISEFNLSRELLFNEVTTPESTSREYKPTHHHVILLTYSTQPKVQRACPAKNPAVEIGETSADKDDVDRTLSLLLAGLLERREKAVQIRDAMTYR
jgi:hypothetical protein